jgi:hypothetical protein
MHHEGDRPRILRDLKETPQAELLPKNGVIQTERRLPRDPSKKGMSSSCGPSDLQRRCKLKDTLDAARSGDHSL